MCELFIFVRLQGRSETITAANPVIRCRCGISASQVALGGQASVSCRHHHLLVSVPSSLLHLPHSKASRLPHHSFERSRAFPHFCSPSEGARNSRVFAHLPKVRNLTRPSACARVSVSSRLLPPSEGVQFSRVFCSPSEGAQSHGARCSACTRVFVSCRFIPPSEGGPNPAVSVSPLEGEHVYLYRNDRKMR